MNEIRELVLKFRNNKKIVKIAAVIIVIIAAVLLFAMKGNSDTISVKDVNTENKSTAETSETTAKSKVYVDVGGEVKSPGVYEVDKDSRLFEAIDKAGGLTRKADTKDLNQAEIVKDGQKIIVSAKESDNNKAASNQNIASQSTADKIININTAASADLQKIKGVGPVMAGKIISYREENGGFKKIDDIKNVSGIGDKTFAKIKSKITV